MANTPNLPNTNIEHKTVWAKDLLLNQNYAATFQCVKCNGVPKKCMNDDNGEILCESCAKNVDGSLPNKAVQNMINNLKIKCINTHSINEPGSNINIDEQCKWNGCIKEYDNHNKECPFTVIICTSCSNFKCHRKLMDKHINECPDIQIPCALSCGVKILRKNVATHTENDCNEQILHCTNDDCKVELKRKDHKNHVSNLCEYRIVECEYVKYGCNVDNIKMKQLQNHMNEYKIQHISNKFDYITNKQQEENKKLHEKLNEMDNKLNEYKKMEHNKLSNVLPKGSIVAFHGRNCPDGWKFCDGTNGTPNLCGRFIYGWSPNNNGTAISNKFNKVGGLETHQLTINEIPSHKHDLQLNYGQKNDNSNVTGNDFWPLVTGDSPKKQSVVIQNGTDDVGFGQSHNNMPPYRVLAYIMKL